MKTKSVLLMAILYMVSTSLQAQKALPVEINSLLSGIPLPQNSQASFASCTKMTDPQNHTVSVQDAGPDILNLESTLKKDMENLGASSMASNYGTSAPVMPSAEQIAQMQSQAQQMQGMTPEQARQMAQQMTQQQQKSSTQVNDPGLMQEIGQAQNATGQLQLLINAFSTKVSQLGGEYSQKLDMVKQTGSCEDYKVQGADIAEPKCACVKGIYLDYYQRRVDVENEYLQKLDELLQAYLPQFRAQIAVIDKTEKDLQYGDAVSMPVLKTQAVSMQQSALGTITPIISVVERAFMDSGTEYAGIYNVDNGYLPEDCQ